MVLLASGSVATSEDCCCGCDCSCDLPLPWTTITFTGVTLPGCCIAVPDSGGPSATYVPCTPGPGCVDLNDVSGWSLSSSSMCEWGHSGGATSIEFQSFYLDEFCSEFDSAGGNVWALRLVCNTGQFPDLPNGWFVQVSGGNMMFAAFGICDPTVPFSNECTCGGFDLAGNQCDGEFGTAVLS